MSKFYNPLHTTTPIPLSIPGYQNVEYGDSHGQKPNKTYPNGRKQVRGETREKGKRLTEKRKFDIELNRIYYPY